MVNAYELAGGLGWTEDDDGGEVLRDVDEAVLVAGGHEDPGPTSTSPPASTKVAAPAVTT